MSVLLEWQKEDYIQAAIEKISPVPENFMIYSAGWVGDLKSDARILKLEGCVFREAKRGSRKGELCIPVPDTGRTVWLSVSEILGNDHASAC